MRYFSERELGERPRDVQEVGVTAWRGILAEIRSRVADGSFGKKYPEVCPDGTFVIGPDMGQFYDAMRAELPGLATYLDQNPPNSFQTTLDALSSLGNTPSTPDILDLVEFCWKIIAEPKVIGSHDYFMHSHLRFDEQAGRQNFREKIETIFRSNGLAYTFTEEGSIARLTPLVFDGSFVTSNFDTGDSGLDDLLSTAQREFLDPHPERRQEALKSLWAAWERLKTIDDPGLDKKVQILGMLNETAGTNSPNFRAALEREAKELTGIGNSLGIRHSETSQESLALAEHADYLFYRLFSLIWLILQRRQVADVLNEAQEAHRSRPGGPA